MGSATMSTCHFNAPTRQPASTRSCESTASDSSDLQNTRARRDYLRTRDRKPAFVVACLAAVVAFPGSHQPPSKTPDATAGVDAFFFSAPSPFPWSVHRVLGPPVGEAATSTGPTLFFAVSRSDTPARWTQRPCSIRDCCAAKHGETSPSHAGERRDLFRQRMGRCYSSLPTSGVQNSRASLTRARKSTHLSHAQNFLWLCWKPARTTMERYMRESGRGQDVHVHVHARLWKRKVSATCTFCPRNAKSDGEQRWRADWDWDLDLEMGDVRDDGRLLTVVAR